MKTLERPGGIEPPTFSLGSCIPSIDSEALLPKRRGKKPKFPELVQQARKSLKNPDGSYRLLLRVKTRGRPYCYHRLTKVKIWSDYGTPEFDEELLLATIGHKTATGRRSLKYRASKPPTPTNVYFVRSPSTGLIKIGKASDVARRFGFLQVGSAEELEMIGHRPDTSGGLLELGLHRDFAHLRVRGEWFSPDDDLMARIAELLA